MREFRLRGDIGGQEHVYPLARGLNNVGSADLNDVVLPLRSVSRHHANIQLTHEGLVVEDLHSKNGTFVNGARAQRATLEPGDSVRFGPVELRLEEIDSDDAELAIVATVRVDPLPGLAMDQSTLKLNDAEAQTPLGLIEQFLSEIARASPQKLSLPLVSLFEKLDANAALVVEGTHPETAVTLASYGLTDRIENLESLWERTANRAADEAEPLCISEVSAQPEPAVSAVLRRPGSAPLCLFVWGDHLERESLEQLSRVVLYIVGTARAAAAYDAPLQRADFPELVFPEGYFPGRSPAIQELYRAMRSACQSSLAVLIEGETGVGKESVAECLHRSSPRRDGAFVAINCAAIPKDLMEPELFGVREGVATGVRSRPGKFEVAQGGTIFLDEVGEIPLELQAKLLRALQEKVISPLGGSDLKVDLRVVAATNSDLLAAVREGRFRKDLYYRIAGTVLRVPPLRTRQGDVPLLVEHFFRAFATETGRSVRGVTVKALRLLTHYPWPGNVRELEHELKRLVESCPPGQAVDSDMLSAPILGATPPTQTTTNLAPASKLSEQIDQLEHDAIIKALERCGGSQRKAAQFLGISRNALARKIKKLGLEINPG